MESIELASLLHGLPLGSVHYFDTLASTNSTALELAGRGAANHTLVVADAQTAGRGRLGRQWFTLAGAALAFSLVLRPNLMDGDQIPLPRLNILGALAVCEAIEQMYSLDCQIKWPNDVLLAGRKAAGVLVEASWEGQELQVLVLGIGLNVTPQAVPEPGSLLFPATSLESELGQPVDRWDLLRMILARLFAWQSHLQSAEFLSAWEKRLAFRGEWVCIQDGEREIIGRLLGLNPDGALRLISQTGESITVTSVEGGLRPWQGATPAGA